MSKKCVKTSNPCFDVEFRADHFIVWGPHAYFDGFRSKNIFLCQKKARKYLFVSKKCVKPVNTAFGVEFLAEHFIVRNPMRILIFLGQKSIFCVKKKRENYRGGRGCRGTSSQRDLSGVGGVLHGAPSIFLKGVHFGGVWGGRKVYNVPPTPPK